MNFNSIDRRRLTILAKLGLGTNTGLSDYTYTRNEQRPCLSYILCKKVTSDEQIKEGINLKDK